MISRGSYLLLTVGFGAVFLSGLAVSYVGGAEITLGATVAGGFFGIVAILWEHSDVSVVVGVACLIALLWTFSLFTGPERIFAMTVLAGTAVLTVQMLVFGNRGETLGSR